MIPTQRNDILKRFGRETFQRAVRIFESGGVIKVESKDKALAGIVRSQNSISVQYIQNIPTDRLQIEGTCTCPVGYNCKHVAAALLHYLSKGASVSVVHTPEPPTRADLEMSTQMRQWLATVSGENAEVQDNTTAEPDKPYAQLVYSLQAPKDNTSPLLSELELIVRKTTFNPKKRTYTGVRDVYSIDELIQRGAPKPYITHDDRVILSTLSAMHPSYWSPTVLSIQHAAHLRMILAGGAAFWGAPQNTTNLELGPTYIGRLAWHMHENYDQSLFCLATKDDEHIDFIIMFDQPWYIDAQAMRCGPLEAKYIPNDMLKRILSMPRVTPAETVATEKQLQKAFKRNMKWPSLKQFHVQGGAHDMVVKPVLRLYGEQFLSWRTPASVMFPLAEFLLDYNGHRVNFRQEHAPITVIHDDRCYVVSRNDEEEKRRHRELVHALPALHPVERWGENYRYRVPLREKQAMALFSRTKAPNDTIIQKEWDRFFSREVEALQEIGWTIEVDRTFPFIAAMTPDDWFAELFPADEYQSSGIEWFNLELGITVGDERINLLPALSQMIRHSQSFLDDANKDRELRVELPDGRFVSLPFDRVQNMLSVLRDVHGMHNLRDGSLKVSAQDVGYLQELEAATAAVHMRWLGGQRLLELGRKLQNFQGIQAVEPPSLLKADLRDYQRTGLNWLQFLREYNLGGLLADDMGLGKTIQVLAYLAHEHEQGRLTKPMLVIAPTSVVSNWKSEAAKFVPHIRTLMLHGSDRHEDFNNINHHDLVLTTYPLILRDKDHWLKHHFHTIVLDEAHAIKNPRTKISLIVNQLKGDTRFCLTGTPIENHLGELWSLFNFLLPGFLETNKAFNDFYKNPIEREQDTTRQHALVHRVKPFVLRRRKEEVVRELPPKTEIIKLCELHKSQRDVYETIRLSMQSRVQEEIQEKGLGRSQIVVLDALLKLRQVCCDPRLMKSTAAKKVKESVKLDVLRDMLEELLEEGRRILIFSQFTSMLALIEDELKIMNVSYVKLIGDTRDRQTPIAAFQSGKVAVFLISLKAGGVGLNLTAADTVIHYDPWWNPAAEDQATDRAHRIGQDKPVFVYKLIAQGTVEEKMLELQKRKRLVAEGVLGQSGEKVNVFTAEDIKSLFAE